MRIPFVPPSVEDTGDNRGEEIALADASGGMCRYCSASTPFHHVPVAERTRKDTVLGDQKGTTQKFGPLKAVLGAVPAVFTNLEVGL